MQKLKKKSKHLKSEPQLIETEIVIDKRTGEILFARDHIDMIDVAKDINPNTDLEEFFNKKPANIFGNKSYKAFCG
jgi:hypothetical protein